MDGNGRWAAKRGWPRTAGHRAGAESLRKVVEAAPELGIGTLTFYAFSADNWKRPRNEVRTLMSLFRRYLRDETGECVKHGVRVSVIGRRDRLSLDVCAAVEHAENATAACEKLHVRIAVDYSSRDAILEVVRRLRPVPEINREIFSRMLAGIRPEAASVDLLIRTGGEKRLSDFLLWECAYSEFCFTPVMWPDFTGADLAAAVADFRGRERRFGGLPSESITS